MTQIEKRTLSLALSKTLSEMEVLTRVNGKEVMDASWTSVYRNQVEFLCANAIFEDIPILLRISQQGTIQRDLGRTQSAYLRGIDSMALEAARTLVRLVEAQPSRDYLVVLEALQRQATSAHAPLEFIPIRFRLARALKRINNLPIPASPPQPTRDLPIPIEKEEANHDELSEPTGLSSAL